MRGKSSKRDSLNITLQLIQRYFSLRNLNFPTNPNHWEVAIKYKCNYTKFNNKTLLSNLLVPCPTLVRIVPKTKGKKKWSIVLWGHTQEQTLPSRVQVNKFELLNMMCIRWLKM